MTILVEREPGGLEAQDCQIALDDAGITTNKNTIPFETRSPFQASGVRLGTPAVTTRGMKEAEMAEVAKLVARALHAVENETELAEVRREVHRICDRFPLYAPRLAAYEKALSRV